MRRTDEELFKELYNKYYGDVYRYVTCLIWNSSNKCDIEQCVQDVFVIAFQNLHKIISMDEGRRKGWILTVTKHITFDFNREYSKRIQREELVESDRLEVLLERYGDTYSLEMSMKSENESEDTEISQILYLIREKLPDKHHRLFDYVYMDKLCDEQIGVLMKISSDAVRMRRIRLAKKMKKIIKNFEKKRSE